MKGKIAFLLTLLLALGLFGSVLADGFVVVTYNDTEASGYDVTGGDSESYIANGDFSQWADGKPLFWQENVALKTGWDVHLAQMDYSQGAGTNYAAGMLIRSNGLPGPQYMSLSQQVSDALVTGDYLVQVHVTAWEAGTVSAYNAVAWYGFGSSSDPSSVDAWYELFPDTYVCPNGYEICNHLNRVEIMNIPAGSYMHVQAAMKFPDMNAWTVFGVDDISILDLDPAVSVDVDSWVDDGDVTWDQNAVR
ncbi:MAG: hypothetical protein H6656_05740 [Ardenticatenaceae bacterium]|nr:hypothetical protein [Anaerolineales bacterium]MCB9006856.1 hypothetical protein [Ardenticatenaceae bacterium]